MSASIYNDKLIKPDDKMLSHDLGDTIYYLNKIQDFIQSNYEDVRPEWKYYNKKSGWILKLFNKKRNVLFVVPCSKYFRVAFTFGEKAAEIIANSELPQKIKHQIAEAKKYVEGRTIQIEVKNENDYLTILDLIRVKLSC